MDMKLKRERGLTLAELLIATFLMSVVLTSAAAAYISALKLFQRMQLNATGTTTNISRDDLFIALEHVVRRGRLANSVELGDSADPFIPGNTNKTYRQVKFRLDYNPGTLLPNNSPIGTTSNTADDQWVKYRFVEVPSGSGVWKLLWKAEASPAGDVSAGDPEVRPNLKLDIVSSYFKAEAVSLPATPPGAVSMSLTGQEVGDPPREFSFSTVVWSHMKTDAT